jgi:hypothetical protein
VTKFKKGQHVGKCDNAHHALCESFPSTQLLQCLLIVAFIVLLWHTEIRNIENYLVHYSFLDHSMNLMFSHRPTYHNSWTINDFLSISTQCAPSILLTMAKYHFFLHLLMLIWRFDPAILFLSDLNKVVLNCHFCLQLHNACTYSIPLQPLLPLIFRTFSNAS